MMLHIIARNSQDSHQITVTKPQRWHRHQNESHHHSNLDHFARYTSCEQLMPNETQKDHSNDKFSSDWLELTWFTSSTDHLAKFSVHQTSGIELVGSRKIPALCCIWPNNSPVARDRNHITRLPSYGERVGFIWSRHLSRDACIC